MELSLQSLMQNSSSAASGAEDTALSMLTKAADGAVAAKGYRPRDGLQSAVQASKTVSMDMLLQESLQQLDHWLNINDLQVQVNAAQGGSNGTP